MSRQANIKVRKCPMCDAAIHSGRATYCSDACKQAAYRNRHGAENQAHRVDGTTGRRSLIGVTDTPMCQQWYCTNRTVQTKAGRWAKYCSDACKVKQSRMRAYQ